MLRDFKRAMGVGLSKKEVERIWGDSISEELLDQLDAEPPANQVVDRKIQMAQEYVDKLPKLGLVQYIGVSGSVGSGFADESDDIDLFIVVKDHTAWIYRFLLKIVGGKKTVWYGQDEQRDKICLNFLCEERGLRFDDHDIFTLNEIYSLKSLYNERYWGYICYVNKWLAGDFYVSPTSQDAEQERGSNVTILLFPFEFLMFTLQVIYMNILRHSPDMSRLWKGFCRGRIEFYPEGFREKILSDFENER